MKKSPFKQSSSLKIALLLSKIVTLSSGTGFCLNKKSFLIEKSRCACVQSCDDFITTWSPSRSFFTIVTRLPQSCHDFQQFKTFLSAYKITSRCKQSCRVLLLRALGCFLAFLTPLDIHIALNSIKFDEISSKIT